MTVPRLTEADKLAIRNTPLVSLKTTIAGTILNCDNTFDDIEKAIRGALLIIEEKKKQAQQ